nr:glucose-1-phosphate thymidylyltransferase RfbA [Hydrocarboniphaga sp.]
MTNQGAGSPARRGILLAGGTGTRLHPMTIATSKQLLPVYDKPMIYYPLCVLLLAGIRDILVICTPRDRPLFETLLGNGKQFGVNIEYAIQRKPKGIGQAFRIAEDFIQGGPSALVLGDNLFFGHGLPDLLATACERQHGASVFAYRVRDPERYGVVEFGEGGRAISLEEKPKQPRSDFAVTGLYFYDAQVVEIAKNLKPSKRGELEITDINQVYLEREQLFVEHMGRGFAWLDTGTPEALLDASNFIQVVQERQGQQICCPEEVAFNMGYISRDDLLETAHQLGKTRYGRYLREIAG